MSLWDSFKNDDKDYDFMIGATVRGHFMEILGVIVSIERFVDGHGHCVSKAILDNGREMNCRELEVTRWKEAS